MSLASLILIDLYTMHLMVLVSLWVMIALFYWQLRSCHRSQKSEQTLKEQNEELSCFVYGAAHDLKAPLRAIDHIARQLEKELSPYMSAEQKDDMTLLQQRVGRLARLVDDLLEYWQAGKSWIKPHSPMIDAFSLVRDCQQMISPPAGFTVKIDPALARIKVFQLPLQQVMVNLIDNAIKHHDKNEGIIAITATEELTQYVFVVSDNGPGIAPAYREKIFETFETLKSRDEVEGSGLGLSLVKRIVARQGGSVEVRETPGGGSTFLFSWPKRQIF